MERAFHLPDRRPRHERAAAFSGGALAVTELSANEMRELLQRLRGSAGKSTVAQRARSVAAAASRFLDSGDSLRRRALAALPAISGFSRPMVEDALPLVFAPLADATELARAVTRPEPAGRLVGIVAAGNVLGVPLPKTALALTAGAACVVKPATGEPLLAALFAEALAEVDGEVASAHAVVWWPGGSGDGEREFLSGIDSLIAYGSDDAIAALAPRVRRLVGHGHKLSIGIVSLDAGGDPRALAAAAADDVALYDQLGCLSPQSLYTIGGVEARRAAFVAALAAALDERARRWPPGDVPQSQALAIRALRDEYEWRELQGENVSVRAGAGWTVIDDPTCGFRPSPLHRTIFVRRLDALEALPRALGEWWPRVESVGMGPQIVQSSCVGGIPRLAALGRMQSPDLAWRQGGFDPLAGIAEERPN